MDNNKQNKKKENENNNINDIKRMQDDRIWPTVKCQ